MNIPEIPATLTSDELWQFVVNALDAGNFTRLDELLRSQNAALIELLEANGEPKEYMDEAFAWACMVGRKADAAALLNKGVDPCGGMKTGLSGFHYAVSGGWLETVKMLIDRKVPMEVENMYGGTVLGQALWSAVNEHMRDHAAIIETLIHAGAEIEPGTLSWWSEQHVPSAETKERVANALRRREMINRVVALRKGGDRQLLASELRELGEFERRMPERRADSISHYEEAIALRRESGDLLKLAHAIRHLGNIYHEDGRLTGAEACLNEALDIYDRCGDRSSLDFANAVRSLATLKDDQGDHEKAAGLWRKANDLYATLDIAEGVRETARRIARLEENR